MNTNVWAEPGGELRKDTLRQTAKMLHQMHQPPARLSDWKVLRDKLRARLRAVAGTFPEPPPLDVREHGCTHMEGYRIVNLTYQSRPGLRATANLYLPEAPGKLPGVLNVHGHWLKGKAANRVFERCHTMARAGFVVLSVDALGSGERGTQPGAFEPHGRQIAAGVLSIGETLLGMQVYDNMRGIDMLQSLERVDAERIGVTGASGGGNQTMWLSALDDRVRAAIPVVSVGTFEAYVTNGNCWCETLPDGLKITEEWALLAMMAPKPLLILNALKEEIPAFFLPEAMRAYDSARQVYRLYDREDRIAIQTINLPHGYFPEMQQHMLGWFKKWLCDEGCGGPSALPPAVDYPEKKLFCFPDTTRPPEVRSLNAYVSVLAREWKSVLLKSRSLDRTAKLRELEAMLRLPKVRGTGCTSATVLSEEDSFQMEKFAVEAEPGVLIPCTLIRPRAAVRSGVVITTHSAGKDAALAHPVSRKLLDEGKALCLVDLRDLGETQWDYPDEALATAARTALWLGRTMLGNWAVDLLAVQKVLVARSHRQIELLGFGETALAALAAASFEKRFSRVTVVDMLSTYVIDGAAPVMNHSIFVPGMLTWGDCSLLAALASCPLEVESLVDPSGKHLSKADLAAWSRETRTLTKKLSGKPSPKQKSRR